MKCPRMMVKIAIDTDQARLNNATVGGAVRGGIKGGLIVGLGGGLLQRITKRGVPTERVIGPLMRMGAVLGALSGSAKDRKKVIKEVEERRKK